jgi:ATP-dependent DNA ligase
LIYYHRADTNICTVYCSPEVFTHPPKTGSVLTIRHAGIKQTGKYKYPFFVRERFDITWDQVRQDWMEQEKKKQQEAAAAAAAAASAATPAANPAEPTQPFN